MPTQRIITKKYRDELLQEVKESVSLERYTLPSFPICNERIGYVRNVEAPSGLLEKMDANDDFISAVALFEAYKRIPPIVAGNPIFWETLAHDELFPYVQRRWPVGDNDLKNHILNHWFVSRGMIRHSLAGLWWSVYCSYDDETQDPYKFTKLLFLNYSFRTTFYGASTLFRYREATLGILTFLDDNTELQSSMELTGRFITNYFNKLGATKQLAYLGRSFFSDELNRIKSEIIGLRNREDISSNVSAIIG